MNSSLALPWLTVLYSDKQEKEGFNILQGLACWNIRLQRYWEFNNLWRLPWIRLSGQRTYSRLGAINYNLLFTGCPKKHGNSVTNSISSLLWISIVIPNFKSHNIIMSAWVYFMKRVKDCKDVSIMSPQEQWRRTSLLCLYTAIFLFY